ncbi:hypothetical protein ALC62_13045 [Cyphomyrmex costatus]|uniref:Uncharacterized protein n=1 Tax=Cyphomyrmex costatus TaxID=456900 RepID=A0A195C8D4_9HYME|nr:hypothetical protein ALC62_13045 [Cyphomyrmex costatus]
MVRSSKNLKRTVTMSTHGDNVTIGSSPYYFRYPRESVKAQNGRKTSRQNADDKPSLKLPVENNIIRATHRTSKSLERIEIVFEEMNNTCFAKAASVSSGWFTIFDYGTNYCNLHNLIVGAGLDRHAKFQELTNDAVCTQFNMAVC